LKYKIKDLNKGTKIFLIEVGSEDITAEFGRYFSRIQAEAVIPGFRKGKVPRQLLESHFKHEAREHVIRELVAVSYDKSVRESGLRPFGLPDISEISLTDEKLTYSATIELRPEFELKKYKGIPIKKKQIVVAQKEIDSVIDRLRTAYATYRVVENRPVALNDLVIVDSSCQVDGTVIDDRKDHSFEVNEQQLLPEYVKNIVGLSRAEQKTFTVTFPDSIPQKEFRGKTGTFTLSIKEIKEKVLPEIDEKFLKSLGDYTTVDALKEAIHKDLQQRKEHDDDERIERELLDAICAETSFDMPQSLLDERREIVREDIRYSLQRQGMNEDAITAEVTKLEKECDTEARRQVQVAFILDKIATLENITVSEEDVSARLYELSRRYRKSVDEVREQYEKEDRMDGLRSEIRNSKAIALVKKEAVLTE